MFFLRSSKVKPEHSFSMKDLVSKSNSSMSAMSKCEMSTDTDPMLNKFLETFPKSDCKLLRLRFAANSSTVHWSIYFAKTYVRIVCRNHHRTFHYLVQLDLMVHCLMEIYIDNIYQFSN